MRAAAFLLVLSFTTAWFASDVDHTSAAWAGLVFLAGVLMTAAVLRVHVVVNTETDR